MDVLSVTTNDFYSALTLSHGCSHKYHILKLIYKCLYSTIRGQMTAMLEYK